MTATAGTEPGRPWRHRPPRSSQVWRMRSASEQYGQPVWLWTSCQPSATLIHDAVDTAGCTVT
jgi:hypothetical protein